MAVTTGRDLDALAGEAVRDTPFLAFDRVRYVGEPVAAVAGSPSRRLNGAKLPIGITRHLIGGRAIGVNIPLERLASDKSLEMKNTWLHPWLMDKIHERKERFYQEPLFVFDE